MKRPGLTQGTWLRVSAALILLIVIAVVWSSRQELRHRLRTLISNRDAESLLAVLTHQRLQDSKDTDPLLADLRDPSLQFELMLKTSRARGVLGARLFDANGSFVAASPSNLNTTPLEIFDLPQLKKLRPQSRFHPYFNLGDLFIDVGQGPFPESQPVLQVMLPIFEPDSAELLGVAEFWIDAENLAKDLQELDADLDRQGSLALGIAAALIIAVLLVAFGKISQSNEQLENRTRALIQANHQLTMASKTTAIGSIASHLLHDLKPPLMSLRTLVNSRVESIPPNTPESEVWAELSSIESRMRKAVLEVIRMMQEHGASEMYEVTMEELGDIIKPWSEPLTQRFGVALEIQIETTVVLPNHKANLVALILQNLLSNAIHSTPRNGRVQLRIRGTESALEIEVQDQGPGLDPAQAARLFEPGKTTKSEGSGIGLAISKQLANNLGGDLSLKATTPSGSIFALKLEKLNDSTAT